MGIILESPEALLHWKTQCGKARIVSTNGCFDLLHVGHLRYLQAGKALGDRLIVALNSDASLQGLKGPARPLVPQDERAELLAALTCVDAVIIFDAPTPVKILQAIAPHIHIKGDQYCLDTLPADEREALLAMGTQVSFIPMVAGHSTSALIEKIVSRYAPSTTV